MYRNEDWGMGRRGSQVYAGPSFRRAHGYGGSSRTRYKHGYGGTRFRRGYNRTSGFYGRYGNQVGHQGELKFHDVDLNDAVIAANGVITGSICLIAEGNGQSTRNGRKCTIKGIQWRYQISLPETNDAPDPVNPDTVRVIMFLDSQCNGAAAAVTDILESADFQSFRNLANSQRFSILYDKTHTLNYPAIAAGAAGTQSTPLVNRSYSFYKKCSITLEWDNTSGVITELKSNNIGVLIVGEAGIAAFDSKIRLRFSDASMRC